MHLKIMLHSFEIAVARMCRHFISDVYFPEFTSEVNTDAIAGMNKKKLVFLLVNI